jgi:sugar transferase EpsL
MTQFYAIYGKRIFDLALAVPALIILWLPMIILALLVRVKLGRPILFKQSRPGRKHKPFTIYKFRSMKNERNDQGQLLDDELRLTRFGKTLRTTSLDELPELFNVFKGDMSIVGPRPLLMQYLSRYSEKQARRHEVKPGLTGWAQVNGRNAITWEQKFTYDVWYVDHLSFGLDLKILAMTMWKLISREGINQLGHATAAEFNPQIPQIDKDGSKDSI